jgi:hypothetical protein
VTATKEPLSIASLELEATIAGKGTGRRDWSRAETLFGQAAARERQMIYTEPPSYPRPVVEGWANNALKAGAYVTAEWAYRAALDREPGSGRALFGIAAALEAQGKTSEAAAFRTRATQAWSKADAELPQLQRTTTSAQQ